jgi:putative nucleotidyltransferase with HDIG domain
MNAVGELPNKLRQIVIARLSSDKLTLPAMPTVAQRCIELLRAEDVRSRDLVREIERDPVASAQVLRLANSAALGGSTCSTVAQAITRIGVKPLKPLFVQMSTQQVFQSKNRQIAASFKRVWEHSLAVGILARDMAALVGSVDQDAAYQAGLLHDIGKPILAVMLLELERAQADRARSSWMDGDAWLEIVNTIHRDVAIALAKKWNMPDEVQRSVAACGDYDVVDRKSVGNLVRFANAIAKQAGIYAGNVDADENQTLIMVGRSLVGVDEEVVERLLADLATRIQQQMT